MLKARVTLKIIYKGNGLNHSGGNDHSQEKHSGANSYEQNCFYGTLINIVSINLDGKLFSLYLRTLIINKIGALTRVFNKTRGIPGQIYNAT